MTLPIQAPPVARFAGTAGGVGIRPLWWCGVCEDAIEGAGKALIGEGCAAATAEFEVACNVALDWIPVIGEGPAEVACGVAGAALAAACEIEGGKITEAALKEAATKACNAIHC